MIRGTVERFPSIHHLRIACSVQAQPKRSEKTKRMLGPPRKAAEEEVSVVVQPPTSSDAFLPGRPAKADQPADVHCRAAAACDDKTCMAALVKGGRCKRKRRVGSNFCKQHEHEMQKPERQLACWESVEDAFEEQRVA